MSDTLDKQKMLDHLDQLSQYAILGPRYSEQDSRVASAVKTLIIDIERGRFDTKEPAE